MNPALMMLLRGGGGPDFDVSLVATAQDAADLTTYTFTGVNFGAEAADRSIIAIVIGRASGTRDVVSATIGGVSATIDFNAPLSTGFSSWACNGVARADVPSGTTGDVVVAFSGAQVHCLVAVYRVTGGTPAKVATGTAAIGTNVTSLSVSATSAAGGFGLASSYTRSGVTWTGATEGYEIGRYGTTDSMGGASADTTAGTFAPSATFPSGTATAFAITYEKV